MTTNISTIPLGVPVVPDVYKNISNSFEFISTQSASFAFEQASSQLISLEHLILLHDLIFETKSSYQFYDLQV